GAGTDRRRRGRQDRDPHGRRPQKRQRESGAGQGRQAGTQAGRQPDDGLHLGDRLQGQSRPEVRGQAGIRRRQEGQGGRRRGAGFHLHRRGGGRGGVGNAVQAPLRKGQGAGQDLQVQGGRQVTTPGLGP